MGCCCSSESEESAQNGDPNERTRLLQDTVGSSYQAGASSGEYGNHYTGSSSQKSDEHSALNKILQQTANKVIDVGALDCQTLEEHEYTERARNYSQTINKLNIPQNILKMKKSLLLTDIPAVEKVLAAPPISHGDLTFMNASSSKLSSALKSICVTHKEDLVVPFGNT